MITHGFVTLPFWAAISGIIVAWYFIFKKRRTYRRTSLPISPSFITLFIEKYGFDRFNSWFFSGGGRGLGGLLWKRFDVFFIDGILVNGSAKLTEAAAFMVRKVSLATCITMHLG